MLRLDLRLAGALQSRVSDGRRDVVRTPADDVAHVLRSHVDGKDA